MAYKPITLEEIVEPLSEDEKVEVSREDFMIPLKIAIEGINRGKYSGNRDVFVSNFRLYARNRSAVRKEIARNPDVAQAPVDKNGPVFIIGLPRSGTTLLQRLLSQDSQFLSPMYWEMVLSTPPGRSDNWRECPRFTEVVNMDIYKMINDGSVFNEIHDLRLDLEEECLITLLQYFIDLSVPFATDHLGEWIQFIYDGPKEHVRNAYQFHKMSMKCIFHGNLDDSKSLLLKSPIHLLYLETLRETYPNAKFIYPVRDIGTVIGSFCSLESRMNEWYEAEPSTERVGRRVFEFIKTCTLRLMKALKTLEDDCFIRVNYTDLVKEPLNTVKKIYNHFDLGLTPETEDAMQRYLVENPQNKHGKHQYSLEKFGISNAQVHDTFAEYEKYLNNIQQST